MRRQEKSFWIRINCRRFSVYNPESYKATDVQPDYEDWSSSSWKRRRWQRHWLFDPCFHRHSHLHLSGRDPVFYSLGLNFSETSIPRESNMAEMKETGSFVLGNVQNSLIYACLSTVFSILNERCPQNAVCQSQTSLCIWSKSTRFLRFQNKSSDPQNSIHGLVWSAVWSQLRNSATSPSWNQLVGKHTENHDIHPRHTHTHTHRSVLLTHSERGRTGAQD